MSSSPEKGWQTFICHYMYKGSNWGFEIVAEDFDDAQARLSALGQFGKVDGIKVAVIPAAFPGAKWLVETIRLMCNFFLDRT